MAGPLPPADGDPVRERTGQGTGAGETPAGAHCAHGSGVAYAPAHNRIGSPATDRGDRPGRDTGTWDTATPTARPWACRTALSGDPVPSSGAVRIMAGPDAHGAQSAEQDHPVDSLHSRPNSAGIAGTRSRDPGPVARVIPARGRHDRSATRPTDRGASVPPSRQGGGLSSLPLSSLPPKVDGPLGPWRSRHPSEQDHSPSALTYWTTTTAPRIQPAPGRHRRGRLPGPP